MAGTRKARVPMSEQIRLINECRQSGMTDADWCRENDIAVSTFCLQASIPKAHAIYVLPLPVAPVIKMLRYSVMYSQVARRLIKALFSFRPD